MITGQGHAITADGQVVTGNGRMSAVLVTAAAATASVILYDNTAASGTVLASLSAVANTSAQFSLPHGMVFSTGVYADITGAGAAAYVVTI